MLNKTFFLIFDEKVKHIELNMPLLALLLEDFIQTSSFHYMLFETANYSKNFVKEILGYFLKDKLIILI